MQSRLPDINTQGRHHKDSPPPQPLPLPPPSPLALQLLKSLPPFSSLPPPLAPKGPARPKGTSSKGEKSGKKEMSERERRDKEKRAQFAFFKPGYNGEAVEKLRLAVATKHNEHDPTRILPVGSDPGEHYYQVFMRFILSGFVPRTPFSSTLSSLRTACSWRRFIPPPSSSWPSSSTSARRSWG